MLATAFASYVGHSLGGAIASLLGIRVCFHLTKDYVYLISYVRLFLAYSFVADSLTCMYMHMDLSHV